MTGEDAGENLPRVPCTCKQSFFLAEALFILNVLASCFTNYPSTVPMVHLKSGEKQNVKVVRHQTPVIDLRFPSLGRMF